jgi:hypothetical protein
MPDPTDAVPTGYSAVCPVCLITHHPDHAHITLACDCPDHARTADPARHTVTCVWRYQWLTTWANEVSRPEQWYDEVRRTGDRHA